MLCARETQADVGLVEWTSSPLWLWQPTHHSYWCCKYKTAVKVQRYLPKITKRPAMATLEVALSNQMRIPHRAHSSSMPCFWSWYCSSKAFRNFCNVCLSALNAPISPRQYGAFGAAPGAWTWLGFDELEQHGFWQTEWFANKTNSCMRRW